MSMTIPLTNNILIIVTANFFILPINDRENHIRSSAYRRVTIKFEIDIPKYPNSFDNTKFPRIPSRNIGTPISESALYFFEARYSAVNEI
jgi:hypothetical protein